MENFKGAVGSSFKPKSPFTVLFNTEPFEASLFFHTFSLIMLPLLANLRSTYRAGMFGHLKMGSFLVQVQHRQRSEVRDGGPRSYKNRLLAKDCFLSQVCGLLLLWISLEREPLLIMESIPLLMNRERTLLKMLYNINSTIIYFLGNLHSVLTFETPRKYASFDHV